MSEKHSHGFCTRRDSLRDKRASHFSDPTDEPVHRAMMRLYALANHRHAAVHPRTGT